MSILVEKKCSLHLKPLYFRFTFAIYGFISKAQCYVQKYLFKYFETLNQKTISEKSLPNK